MGVTKLKNKKRAKNKTIVSFDQEIVTKDCAEKLLLPPSNMKTDENFNENSFKEKKGKKKQKQDAAVSDKFSDRELGEYVNDSQRSDFPQTNRKRKRKEQLRKGRSEHRIIEIKKKKHESVIVTFAEDSTRTEKSENDNNPEKNQPKYSIRTHKRENHAKLLEVKKMKTELILQERALNYLSLWKHNRDEWKFEKLRQIWLQQNMYDSAKVPDEFWGTLINYWSKSKGHIRDVLMKEALAIMEEWEHSEIEEDDSYKNKLDRARAIIQNLQE